MKIKKILSGFKHRLFSDKEKIVKRKLLGETLTVIDGTIRKKVDYDDAWFYALAMHCNVFFDIGANIGYTSLIASLTNKVSRIILVDPNPSALNFAFRNLLYNNRVSNCNFFPAFVSHSVGEEVKFFTMGVGAAGSLYPSHAQTASMVNNYFFVKTTTIDYLTEYYSIDPDLVKVDVEGAEYDALNGATSLAKKRQTKFLVEMHKLDELSMHANANNVLTWCREVGYEAWYLAKHTKLNNGAEIAHRGKCHLLLQPSDWEFPEFLMKIRQGAALPI